MQIGPVKIKGEREVRTQDIWGLIEIFG